MKLSIPHLFLLGLFTFAAAGSASAAQMKAPPVAAPAHVAAKAQSPWPNLASSEAVQQPLLAHDSDRYWRDGRWHSRRDDWRREQWRKEQWRKEQHRREIERRRAAAHHHDHRYQDDHRYYRR